jgi:hypothetical protein
MILCITVLVFFLDLDQLNVIYAVLMNSECFDHVTISDVYVFYSMDYVIDPLDEI